MYDCIAMYMHAAQTSRCISIYMCTLANADPHTECTHRVRRPALYWHSIAHRSESLHHRYGYLPLLEPFRS